MEIGITIFFFASILFLIIGFIVSDDTTPVLCGAFGGMCLVAAIALMIDSQNNNSTSSPSALDVYRGKTNLVVTYSDSVATDSVVVFKK